LGLQTYLTVVYLDVTMQLSAYLHSRRSRSFSSSFEMNALRKLSVAAEAPLACGEGVAMAHESSGESRGNQPAMGKPLGVVECVAATSRGQPRDLVVSWRAASSEQRAASLWPAISS
jgi:hypothetical protein